MVLNIVLSNAFRRSETGGEVFFGVSVVQDRLRVVVSNRGEGVDLGQIEFLSDRYRLLDYLESRGKGGLSQKGDMELAICHNLAAKLGGSSGSHRKATLRLSRCRFPNWRSPG